MSERIKTFGAEIEKPVSNLNTGLPQGVTQEYFKRLSELAFERGMEPTYHDSQIKVSYHLGVITKDLGEQGLDNGTNLLETALPVCSSLEELNQLMHLDLETVQKALKAEGATVVNMSNHPLGNTDQKSYETYVAPKGIYAYIRARGWDHSAGIDAKAQNSPTTGVSAENAADAVSVVIGFGAVNIGLFGNSPVSEGKVNGIKENRLTLWEKMMAKSSSDGDRKTARFPDIRFSDLADYMEWMFGKDTNIHFVQIQNGGDYKSSSRLITINGDPSVLEYLAKPEWTGTFFGSGEKMSIKPSLSHLEAMQFAQFTGARIRWAFNGNITIEEFLEAQKKHNLEEVFAKGTKYTYIEGRDPGANFPDRELYELGDEIAKSVVIAPAAIQAGLINNLDEATQLLDSYPWQILGQLREEAIHNGLNGNVESLTVKKLANQVLEIASRGLRSDQQWMLAYPKYVLESGQNGADRFLKSLGDNTDRDSIAKALVARNVYMK